MIFSLWITPFKILLILLGKLNVRSESRKLKGQSS